MAVRKLGRSLDNPLRLRGQRVSPLAHLEHAATPQRLRETALHVQSKSHNVWVFTYNAPSAIAVRGTAEEIALAGRLIQEQDK
jgi:hypothetical protein